MKWMFDDLHTTMEWGLIDTVVFDVGNVLLRFVPSEILKEQLPGEEDVYSVLMERIFRSPYWLMRDRGTATKEEAIEGMCLNHEELRPQITKVMNGWVEMKEMIPEGINALKKCKSMGKKVYILSNYGDDSFEVVDRKYDFFRLCDEIVISSRVHMVKPELDIFRYVTETYGNDPQRTLFIDDNIANIEAALESGWNGIVYDRPGKLTDFFR